MGTSSSAKTTSSAKMWLTWMSFAWGSPTPTAKTLRPVSEEVRTGSSPLFCPPSVKTTTPAT